MTRNVRYSYAVFHLDPQDRGEIAMFRGEGVWGDRRGGVWGEAMPLPNGGLGAVPPEKFLKFGNKY